MAPPDSGTTPAGGDPSGSGPAARSGGGAVLAVLASGQFLMALDSSVMNVSIRSVANDLGTTVSGIQTAITLYTLVMAAFMITGGTIGGLLGRRRAFAVGLCLYGAGSLTTALAPNLTVLIIGWSGLEGLGAALIMPAIVALVAGNVDPDRRTAAYGMIAAAGAVAVAAGPLIGGAVTTVASWRWVFVGEVAVVLVILVSLRTLADTPVTERRPFDLVGAGLSVVGLGATVFGVLRSGDWGWVRPRPGGPSIGGLSPVLWLLLGGLLVIAALLSWERRRERTGREPLFRPSLFASRQLSGGLTLFFFQFLVQSGIFFVIPLFLSVVLELSAFQTGLRLIPLSVGLLASALLVPRLAPHASPRTVVRLGLGSLLAGVVVLLAGLDPGASAAVVLVPMGLVGIGIGAIASQLGAVTVSSVPERRSAEVGGLQNTATNFGASLGTALVGAVLIGSLHTTFLQGVTGNPDVPASVTATATVRLDAGVPFVSDSDLRAALATTDLSSPTRDAIVAENAAARLVGLRTALAVVALLIVVAILCAGLLPRRLEVVTEDVPVDGPGARTADRSADPSTGEGPTPAPEGSGG